MIQGINITKKIEFLCVMKPIFLENHLIPLKWDLYPNI